MLDISAIHQNFRGQCPRVRAFFHVCFLQNLYTAVFSLTESESLQITVSKIQVMNYFKTAQGLHFMPSLAPF